MRVITSLTSIYAKLRNAVACGCLWLMLNVQLVSCERGSFAWAAVREYLVGGHGPGEGMAAVVPAVDEVLDRGDEVLDRGEAAACPFRGASDLQRCAVEDSRWTLREPVTCRNATPPVNGHVRATACRVRVDVLWRSFRSRLLLLEGIARAGDPRYGSLAVAARFAKARGAGHWHVPTIGVPLLTSQHAPV